ncbi:CMD1 [Symbiodinium necroappetens]|uniref:CMD1 protein n=1 Tax=Symbiodinium necroappetens TaxID=1628268 RepID=A0A812U3I9_9DINO|nr:CMD1 [Symbiodinium necroappetens]
MKKPHNSRSEEAFFSPKLPGQVDDKRTLGKSKDRKGLHGSRKLLPKLKGAGDACAESTSSLPGSSRSCGTGSRGFEEARPRPSPKAKSREGKEGKEGRQSSRDASAPATRSRAPKEPQVNQVAEKPPRRRLPPKPEAKPEKAEAKAEAKADAKPRPEKPDSSDEARDQKRNQASEPKKARKPAQPASAASFSSALSGLGDSEPEPDASMPASPKSVQGGYAPETPISASTSHAASAAVKPPPLDSADAAETRRQMREVLQRRLHRIREKVQNQRAGIDAQKKYEHLPGKEREAVERAFFHYDADLSGYLDYDEIVPALRELGLSGSNAIEKREIMQVCRNVMTATRVQSLHRRQADSLQQVLNAQRSRMQGQPRIKLEVKKAAAPQQSPKAGDAKQARGDGKRASGSRRSSFASSQGTVSDESGSEDFEVGVESPGEDMRFDFMTFAALLVPKVRQRLTELQSTTVMRYFCNFDREGTGAISVLKCLEIARCLKMDQLHMLDALKDNDFSVESDTLVDFDSFEQCVMGCRERTNRQLRQREIEILVEMRVRSDLFQECRESIPQIYEVFRRLSGDVGPIGVVSANEAFLAVYELGMMPREQWQKEEIKQFLVPIDSEDHVYAQTELNFEDFLTFLRNVRTFNDEQRLTELTEHFARLDKDGNGHLDMKELNQLLEETGCCPRSRKEQEEVRQLIQSTDVDGNGVIDFGEFKELVQRIEERFASLRYESEVDYAVARGFTEVELGNFRAIFEHLDVDNSGRLEMNEVRQCLNIIQHKATWQAFDDTWRQLDKDASGSLDFHEFIDFMRAMRDGEGIFALDREQKLPNLVSKLDDRTLRSVLSHYGLSKSYLWALDRAQLLQRFCDCFLIMTTDNPQDVLKVTTVSDLLQLAKEKGESLDAVRW